MSKTTIAIIIYVLGLIFGALVLDLWSAETSPKALLGLIWTALFLIALYFAEFKNKQLRNLGSITSKFLNLSVEN